jgi:hypothetical protein
MRTAGPSCRAVDTAAAVAAAAMDRDRGEEAGIQMSGLARSADDLDSVCRRRAEAYERERKERISDDAQPVHGVPPDVAQNPRGRTKLQLQFSRWFLSRAVFRSDAKCSKCPGRPH